MCTCSYVHHLATILLIIISTRTRSRRLLGTSGNDQCGWNLVIMQIHGIGSSCSTCCSILLVWHNIIITDLTVCGQHRSRLLGTVSILAQQHFNMVDAKGQPLFFHGKLAHMIQKPTTVNNIFKLWCGILFNPLGSACNSMAKTFHSIHHVAMLCFNIFYWCYHQWSHQVQTSRSCLHLVDTSPAGSCIWSPPWVKYSSGAPPHCVTLSSSKYLMMSPKYFWTNGVFSDSTEFIPLLGIVINW